MPREASQAVSATPAGVGACVGGVGTPQWRALEARKCGYSSLQLSCDVKAARRLAIANSAVAFSFSRLLRSMLNLSSQPCPHRRPWYRSRLLKLGDPSLGGSDSSLREPEVLPRPRARAAVATGQRLFQEYSPRCRAGVARPSSLRCAQNRLSVAHKYPTQYASRLPRLTALLLFIGEHPPPQRALNIHGWQCDSFSSLAHADPHIRVRVASESTTCLLDGFVSLLRFPCATQRVTPSEIGLGGTGHTPPC